MYENVRSVSWGLILSFAYTVILGIVAMIDPFGNGVPWANWLTLTVIAVIAVTVATFITATADHEGDFWGFTIMAVVVWAFFGAMICLAIADGIHTKYHSLIATAWALPLVLLPITALAQYLIGAAAHSHQEAKNNLRRVA